VKLPYGNHKYKYDVHMDIIDPHALFAQGIIIKLIGDVDLDSNQEDCHPSQEGPKRIIKFI
jgi:hypothetical protein